jgi:hypothetical protein
MDPSLSPGLLSRLGCFLGEPASPVKRNRPTATLWRLRIRRLRYICRT